MTAKVSGVNKAEVNLLAGKMVVDAESPDVAEAIIGAICIDSGFEMAINFVDRHWKYLINSDQAPIRDNKTILHEQRKSISN